MEHCKLSFKNAFKPLLYRFENENQNYHEKLNSVLEGTKLDCDIKNANVQKSNEVDTQRLKPKSSTVENLNYSNIYAKKNKKGSKGPKNVEFSGSKCNGGKNDNLNCNSVDTFKPLSEDFNKQFLSEHFKQLKMPNDNSIIVEKREVFEHENFAPKQEESIYSSSPEQEPIYLLPLSFEYKTGNGAKHYTIKSSGVTQDRYKTPNHPKTQHNKCNKNCVTEDVTKTLAKNIVKAQDIIESQWRDFEKFEEQNQNEPEHLRKLFIGNIDKDTSETNLMYYFDQFGAIEECVVIRNPKTRVSKCFGYVVFQHEYMLTGALAAAPHEIDDRKVTLFELGNDGSAPRQFCKLSVKGLNNFTTVRDLKLHFRKWGTVTDCVIMRDSKTGKLESSGFVTYTHFHMMMDALAYECHKIKGKKIHLDIFSEKSSEPVPVCSRTLITKNLDLQTNEGTLMFYFGKFGKVEHCVIMKDPSTRISRGFGYLVFEQISTIAAIQTASPHKIDNQEVLLFVPDKVDIKPECDRTLHIENLNYETEEDTIIYYFGKFGVVESCAIMREEITRMSKGCGYVIFEQSATVDKARHSQPHVIDSKELMLKFPYKVNDKRIFHSNKETNKSFSGSNWNKRIFYSSKETNRSFSASKGNKRIFHSNKETNKSFSASKGDKRIFPCNKETSRRSFSASKVKTGADEDLLDARMYPRFIPKKCNLKQFDGAGINIFKD